MPGRWLYQRRCRRRKERQQWAVRGPLTDQAVRPASCALARGPLGAVMLISYPGDDSSPFGGASIRSRVEWIVCRE